MSWQGIVTIPFGFRFVKANKKSERVVGRKDKAIEAWRNERKMENLVNEKEAQSYFQG